MSPPRTPEPKSPEPTNYVNRVFIEPTVICWTGASDPKPIPNKTHLLHSSVERKDSLGIRSTGVPVKIQSGIPGPTPIPLNFAVIGKPVVQRAAPTIRKE
ncbi:hypothetical protein Q9L58_006997 [Maublancomyces gigas]|uniref:Uncharacterized protein n=1 Tax=Discina gigas TaxID=1032678 RepID=A0ABR3GE87_9PEZI